MAQAGRTVNTLQGGLGGQQGLQGATVHTARLERAFRVLAFSAGSIPGPLGNVAFALTQLVAKTGPLIAITAIFAGIAVGIQLAKKELQEMIDIAENARKRVQRELDAIAKAGAGSDPRLLSNLRAALAAQVALVAQFEASVPRQLGGAVSPDEKAALNRINALNAAILELTHTVTEDSTQALTESRYAFEHVADAGGDVEKAIQRMRLQYKGVPADVAASIAAHDAETRSLQAATEADRKLLAQFQADRNQVNQELKRLQLRGLVDPKTLKQVIPEQDVLDLRRQLEGWRDPLSEELRALGMSLGKQFILGMVTGIQSMQDFIKSAVIQILSFGVDQLIGGIFGSGGAGDLVKGKGSAPQSPAIGPASFSMNVGGLPAPTNPFAVMRDAEWLRALTGSLIQARANGFRS
jgi:hypothetical protein